MQTVSIEDMGYYEPPPGTKKVQVAARVSPELNDALDAVVRLWKLVAEASKRDPDAVDKTYVITRLLSVGVDGAFAEFGAKPETPEEWKKLEALIAKKFGR